MLLVRWFGLSCHMVIDWVPRVLIPQREAQVETMSPSVNQPGNHTASLLLHSVCQDQHKSLSKFKTRRTRFYLLMGKWPDSTREVEMRNTVTVISEYATRLSCCKVFEVI